MERVRIDKWLWAARFFKTRALATKACELGRIAVAGQLVKPSRDVHLGDQVQVKNGSGDFQIKVLRLDDIRGPAPIAQTMYLETEESKVLREQAREQRKNLPVLEALPEGRPSGRNRRQYDRVRRRF